MKRIALLAMASGLALAAAAPADATVTIGYSINGGAITTLATDATTPGSAGYVGTQGAYQFNVGAFGTPATNNIYNLLTQSINISSAASAGQTLNVYVTDSNLPTLNGGTLMSAFTSNTLDAATAVISSYYSTTNQLFGGTLLRTASFATPGTFMGTNVVSATGPFSLTTRYDITFSGAGNFNGTANITAVPEPATWGMMILGFGLMGGVMRRRKTTVAFA